MWWKRLGDQVGIRVGFDRVKLGCHLNVRVEVRSGQLGERG